ncbi:EpsG family protein [Aliivibrio sp. S3MY1]|uniref:EpsG family protein n=1 Tax=unclassified Aliivibrio TaxID=2645654 RepID=UPI002379F024|nr:MULTISPECIES: EpsG family protein [unclassified Aliivibrio]MDD9196710.1 EpsG family protein [Aliivibrio sp. S3MY1]MDD9199799.1 EpsG family protein [Aliivibrio sp. S2MY1]
MYLFGLICVFLYPILLAVSLGKYRAIYDVLFGLTIVIFASLLFSSRVYFLSESDDMIRYYSSYLQAGSYDYLQYMKIVNREWVYISSDWLTYQVFGVINPRIYLFLKSLTFNGIFVFALFKIFKQQRYRLFIILAIVTVPSIGIHTQLVRQLLGFAIFLLAIGFPGKSKHVLFLILSIGVHKVSIIYFILLWSYPFFKRFIFNNTFLFLALILCLFLGRLINIDMIVEILQSIPEIGKKANFITMVEIDRIKFGITSLIVILLCFFNAVKLDRILLVITEKEMRLFYVLMLLLLGTLILSSINVLAERFIGFVVIFFPWFFIIAIDVYFKKSQRKFLTAVFLCFAVIFFNKFVTGEYSASSIFNGELVLLSKK